jgi:hypothetical protein
MSELTQQPPKAISAVDLARAYVDKNRMERGESAQAIDNRSRSEFAKDSIKEVIGVGDNLSTLEKAGNLTSTVYGLATNPQKELIETTAEMIVAGTVGAKTQSVDDAVHAAGLVGTAIAVGATGGIAAIPIVAMQYKDTKDYLKERDKRVYDTSFKASNDRIELKTAEYKFSAELGEREMRRAMPEADRIKDHNNILNNAMDAHKLGFAGESTRARIELETLVKQAGGETESWFQEFENFKETYAPEEPVAGDFFGKANQINETDSILGSSNHLFKELSRPEHDRSSTLSMNA